MKATERLYLTKNRDRVVKEGDLEAAFLFVTPGKEISAADVKKYGLEEPKASKKEEEKVEVEAKAVDAPPENKAEAPAEVKDTPRRGR